MAVLWPKFHLRDMCSRYEAPLRQLLQSNYPTAAMPSAWDKPEVWPGYAAPFIRRPPEADAGDEAVPSLQVEVGNFGLIPFWAKDDSIAKRTYNARSETVADKPAFRDAWKRAQHCIIPAQAIYEPDWRSGKAVPTRITRADGLLLGIAGLYERRKVADGSWAYSFHHADAQRRLGHLMPSDCLSEGSKVRSKPKMHTCLRALSEKK